jgi:phosphoserine aminotransferase
MTAGPRPFNFSAGPAVLPEPVLQQVSAEMLDWHGSGMSVMEMSHRGREFISIYEDAESTLRALLSVPPEFRILFMQGGGLGENAIVPMNLAHTGKVDVAVTGSWSKKSAAEARRYADVQVVTNAFSPVSEWHLREGADYVHVCTNETIDGIEFHELPQVSTAPLVIDCSSHILSRPIDWSRVGCAFAGAQKNIGPAGLTIVFVREDLLDRAQAICPSAFNYKIVAEAQSMFNTPPTFAIYVAGLVFQWIKAFEYKGKTGLAAIEQRDIDKAALLYSALDGSSLYENRVPANCRSRMNVPFYLKDERLNDAFLAGAKEAQLLQLKGHKSVGGMRASIYNAMPLEGVQALTRYLQDFEKRHG